MQSEDHFIIPIASLEELHALDECSRVDAVRLLFRECADVFRRASAGNRTVIAQEAATAGLAQLMGLFPDPDDPAHHLLAALIEAITDARAGHKNTPLLSSSRMIPGTKQGSTVSWLRAFAIAACDLLKGCDDRASENQIQNDVAEVLARMGFSLKAGDHGMAKPITKSAVRDWWKRPDQFPLQHRMAERMLATHTQNIINRDVSSYSDILAYIAQQAAIELKPSAAGQPSR